MIPLILWSIKEVHNKSCGFVSSVLVNTIFVSFEIHFNWNERNNVRRIACITIDLVYKRLVPESLLFQFFGCIQRSFLFIFVIVLVNKKQQQEEEISHKRRRRREKSNNVKKSKEESTRWCTLVHFQCALGSLPFEQTNFAAFNNENVKQQMEWLNAFQILCIAECVCVSLFFFR